MPPKGTELQLIEFYNKLQKQKGKKDRLYIKEKLNHKLCILEAQIEVLETIIGQSSKENNLSVLLAKLKEQTNQIEENIVSLEEPFSLFIVGMGKYGKSTLLNALLGSSVVEMDDEPKTWKIDIFYGSEESNVKIIYNDGKVVKMTRKEAKELLIKEEKQREDSLERIEDEFELKRKEAKTIEDKKKLKQELTDCYLYLSPVVETRWPFPKNELLNSFRLVDTPGLKQNLPGKIKKSLEDYYHKADGVLWLLDATKVSSAMGKQLMEDLQESLSDIGGNTNNVVAVLNFIDKVRKKHGQESVDRVIEEAHKIYGKMFNDIVPISAREALEGKEKGDKALLESSGYNRLMEVITRNFLYKSNDIQIDSKLQGIKNISNLMYKSIKEYEKLLISENKKRIELKENFEKDINSKKKNIESNYTSILDKYKYEVEKNMDMYIEDLFNQNSDRNRIIKDKIFNFNDFVQKINEEMRKAFKELQNCNDYHIKISRFRKYKYIETYLEKLSFANRNDIELPSLGRIDFSTTIKNDFFSFLNEFQITGTIIKMYKSYKFKNDLKRNLNSLVNKVEKDSFEEISSYVSTIKSNVAKVREESFKLFYCDSESIEQQLDEMDVLKEELQREITKNNIYEYITGEIKTSNG